MPELAEVASLLRVLVGLLAIAVVGAIGFGFGVLSRMRAMSDRLEALTEAHAARETDVADAGAYARGEMARRRLRAELRTQRRVAGSAIRCTREQ